jgi:hypothetical protein
MNHTVVSYLLYLAITLTLTVWVANVLFKNGRIFLVDIFKGNQELADSVNRLLVVGFYLINIGYVSLFLREDEYIQNVARLIELLSRKVGIIILILGAMHFFNLFVFFKLRKRAKIEELTPSPVRRDVIAPAKIETTPEPKQQQS